MRKIDHPSRITSKPQLDYVPTTGGYFNPGQPGIQEGTVVTAAWLNDIQDELENAISINNQTPNPNDTEQLKKAILSIGYKPKSGDENKLIKVNGVGTGLTSTDIEHHEGGVLATNGTSHWRIPYGTTEQRPSAPNNGALRINSDTASIEWFHNGVWMSPQIVPSGTRMLFYQPSAPVGWSLVTGVHDTALRVTTMSDGGSIGGGPNSMSSVTNSSVTVGGSIVVLGHILTINEIPLHSHPYIVTRKTETTARMNVNGGIMMRDVPENFVVVQSYTGSPTGAYNQLIGGVGGNQAHTHGVEHSLSFNLNLKYANVIICEKD